MNLRVTRQARLTGGELPAARLFGLALILWLAVPAGAAFEDLGAGARGPGMGNAVVSACEDVYAVHYNPAALGVVARPQFTASYTQLFSGLTDGSKLGTSFFGYAQPLGEGRHGTLAGAFNSFSLDGGLYQENTFYLSYGRLAHAGQGGNDLFLGSTVKYLHSSFGSFSESGNATNGIIRTGQPDPLLNGKSGHNVFDADIGALYRFGAHYQLGLQAAHITRPNMAFGSGASDRLPTAVKLGFNYKSLISNLVAQVETKKAPDGSTDNVITAAAERWFPKAFMGDFAVRGAIGTGTREYRQVSMGLSYRTRRVQVDYGFSLPLGTLTGTSGTHRMAMTFLFGKPTEREETLEMLMTAMRGLKTAPERIVEMSTVTVFVTPEPSEKERAITARLAAAEEAIRTGRYREAASLAAAAIRLDAGVAAAWQDLGIANLGMEKYRSSLRAWEKAYELEKSPALREAIKGYMRSITRLERSSKAKPRPQPKPSVVPAQGPSLSQQEIEELLNRGVDLFVDGEFSKSREVFEEVLKADPDNVEALKALRRLRDEQGH